HVKSLGAGQTLMTGLAILDPYTRMETPDNDNNFEVQDQPMQMNLGTAYNLDLGLLLNLTFSLDYRDVHQAKEGSEYSEDLRLGVEVATPIVQFLGGYSGGKYSYGVKGDIGFFDAYLGF